MSKITISDIQPIESEYAELSDLELESVVGGKRRRRRRRWFGWRRSTVGR